MPGPRGGSGICKSCKKEKDYIPIYGKSRGLCRTCYKKFLWKPKIVKCPRCNRMKPHHGKGLCRGCYTSIHQLENVKDWNARRYHNIEPELYRKVKEKCVVCEFNEVVELHHLDHNVKNNSEDNFVGLCPNHHKMIHMKKHQKGIFDILEEKDFKIPKSEYSDGFFKK